MSMHAAFSGCHDGYQQSPQQQQQLQSPPATPKSFAALSASTTDEREKMIYQMEVSQLEKLKNEAKKMLIQYDENFQKEKGRLPSKEEKEPMRLFYDIYKNLRNETLRKEGHKRLVRLRIQKWELKEQLKEYDKIFAMSNGGRGPTTSERGPIRKIYEQYTATKDEIQRLEKTEEQAKLKQLMRLQKKEKNENAANAKWEKTYPRNEESENANNKTRGGFEGGSPETEGEPIVTFQATSSTSSSLSHSSASASATSSTITGYDDERPRGVRVSKGEHKKIMRQSARKLRTMYDKKKPRQQQMKQKGPLEEKKTYEKNLLGNNGQDETRDPSQEQNRNSVYNGSQGFSPSVLMSTHSNYRFQKTPQHQQQQQQHIQSNDDEARDPPPSSPVVTESRASTATTSTATTSTSTTSRSKFEEFGEIVVLRPKKKEKPKSKIQLKKEKSRKEKWEEGNAKRKMAMRKRTTLYKQ